MNQCGVTFDEALQRPLNGCLDRVCTGNSAGTGEQRIVDFDQSLCHTCSIYNLADKIYPPECQILRCGVMFVRPGLGRRTSRQRGPFVPRDVACTRAGRGGTITGIEQSTGSEREAATTDAVRELVAKRSQLVDTFIKL